MQPRHPAVATTRHTLKLPYGYRVVGRNRDSVRWSCCSFTPGWLLSEDKCSQDLTPTARPAGLVFTEQPSGVDEQLDHRTLSRFLPTTR